MDYLKLTAGTVTLALVASVGKVDAEQPHTHVENVPFEQSVSTLSYEPTMNIAAPAFGFDQSDYVSGFDSGGWS
jgi:hypothetical protein